MIIGELKNRDEVEVFIYDIITKPEVYNRSILTKAPLRSVNVLRPSIIISCLASMVNSPIN